MTPPRAAGRPRLRRAIAAAVLALAMAAPAGPAPAERPAFAGSGTIELAFTPHDHADTAIVAAIGAAEREVLVLAYSFTHPRIARALAAAHRRGLRVEVVADRGQTLEQPQSAVPALARDGVPVWLDGNFAAAHNKVIVIDADGPRATTITGSFNFTLAAQRKNAENVLLLRANPDVARAYRANFRRLQEKAQRWTGDEPPPAKAARSAR